MVPNAKKHVDTVDLDINQCSNVNGTCLTGCYAGYQGHLCKSSKCYDPNVNVID